MFGTWRAICHLQRRILTDGYQMRLSNDALYLSHRLLPYIKDPIVLHVMEDLQRCGNQWFEDAVVRAEKVPSD